MKTILAVLVVALALAGPRAAWSEDAEVEHRMIEALIKSVAELSDATFLRNGKSYSASSASRFLLEKWQSRHSDVHSAEDFIDRVGSFSSQPPGRI